MTDASTIADTIADNLQRVQDRLAAACRRAGRDPSTVRLIGISKTFPLEYVEAAVAAGLTDLGENRVQEAVDKVARSKHLDVTWHLVGHLQSNKARRAVGAMDWIHSVDSVELLERLDRTASETETTTRVLAQVDLAGETTKYGAPLDQVDAILEAGARCRSIRLCGLMVLPPWSDDPEQSRPYFRRLATLRADLVRRGHAAELLEQLSMGMSHDFEVAVEEGATMIRVGRGIFGPRG